jgi:glycosyltransferase involved in cell wall biosynthesis
MNSVAQKAGGADPRITFGLITYCQESFVREAVRAALAQRHTPLEIVILDDASPDDTFEQALDEAKAYRGPHQVRVLRNQNNLGIGNFNQLMKIAGGDLVVIAHGDDISHPERVSLVADAWMRTGASMVTSNALMIDDSGHVQGLCLPPGEIPANSLEDLSLTGWNFSLLGAVLAWDRKIFEVFGPLDADKSALTSDWILPFRAAALTGIHYLDQPLVKVRKHAGQKNSRYLSDQADPLANEEALLANHLMQRLYMLETLEIIAAKQLRSSSEIDRSRRLLTDAILRQAFSWRTLRNRLYAGGKRTRWSALDKE